MKLKQAERSKTGNRKYPWWFYGSLFTIPLIVIVGLEVSLQVFNYGNNYETFVKISDQFPEYLFFNPQLPQKYFSDKSVVPSVIPDGFKAVKDSNTFRIFVLGGSSTAGYPYPTNASFPRQLKRRLQLVYPDASFEVVNLGVSAVNSIFMTDIIDDVLEQSPDLLLIYAGHNEYYGALGAAVSASFNIPQGMNLWLRGLKTYQLVENFIKLFSPEKNSGGRTLMAQMAGENVVPFESEKYFKGLEQFQSNIEYIFSKCESAKVTVIIGSLTSNLLQRPLDYILNPKSAAIRTFDQGVNRLDDNPSEAKELLIKAKDEDALRFRAPEAINKIIIDKAKSYNVTVVNADSLFRTKSIKSIAGYDLFADHLHPNINGYFELSKIFFESIIRENLIKWGINGNVINMADRILLQTFPFTGIDSTFADINLRVLLNSYPFVLSANTNTIINNYPLNNKSDSLAMDIIKGKIDWDKAHSILAEFYFNNEDYKRFFNEMMTLIYDKSFDTHRYVAAANYLKIAGRFDMAYTIFSLLHKIKPSLYTLKNMGDMSYSLKNYPRALYFYNQILSFEKNDPVILTQAAECNLKLGNNDEAEKLLIQCQKIQPNSRQVKNLLDSLTIIKSISP